MRKQWTLRAKYHIDYILCSIKSSTINIIHNYKTVFKRRENGISVLLPTQNEETIIKLTILSFLDFADEIIVVDNGSIDNTKEIIKEIANQYSKVVFYDKPELRDLFENRRFALGKSKYRWVCRFDSDFVAYTSGTNNIMKLRKFLLNLPKKKLRPKIILLSKVNIDKDFYHTKIYDSLSDKKLEVIRGAYHKIYEYFPLLTFQRFKSVEIGTFRNLMKKIILKTIYYMHCTIKSNLYLFLRSGRPYWRKIGDYKKYPTIKSYMLDIIKEKYGTNDFNEACKIFMKNREDKDIYIEYKIDKYLPYPEIIKKELKKRC